METFPYEDEAKTDDAMDGIVEDLDLILRSAGTFRHRRQLAIRRRLEELAEERWLRQMFEEIE